MKAKVSFKVGQSTYQLEIEEPTDRETLHKAAVFGNPPCYCHECKNKQYFRLDSHKGGEYFYTEVVCTVCGAKSTLTEKKDKSFFWKKFEKWEGAGQSKSQKPNQSQQSGGQSGEDEDEIPF